MLSWNQGQISWCMMFIDSLSWWWYAQWGLLQWEWKTWNTFPGSEYRTIIRCNYTVKRTINYSIYVNHPKETLQGNFTTGQGGLFLIVSTQIRWFLWWSDGRLDHHKGKKKKGDEVDDEDNDNVVRTSVSQDRATATLYTEYLFLSTEYTV